VSSVQNRSVVLKFHAVLRIRRLAELRSAAYERTKHLDHGTGIERLHLIGVAVVLKTRRQNFRDEETRSKQPQ
jgi:hypothetical protein